MVTWLAIRVAGGVADGAAPVDAVHSPGTPDARPNVVMIMVDDLPPLDGRLYSVLPNIRQTFVDQGVDFTNFQGETPLCCPGRVGFFTGQHTFHHGVTVNDATLFNPSMSLATQLHGAGYQTMLAGKYLNHYGPLAGTVPPGWDHFSAKTSINDYYDYTIWNDHDKKPERHGHKPADYFTDVVSQKAVAQLRAAAPDRPVFAWFAVTAPHRPWIPAPRYAKDKRCVSVPDWSPPNYAEAVVSDKPAYVQAEPQYDHADLRDPTGYDLEPVCRAMLAADDMVGRVRAELQREGRLANTIFVFSGDNGMNFGSHRLEAKFAPYETGLPFFITWPARLGTTPRNVDDLVMNIDFAPTICELAGCTMGPYPNGQHAPDGSSFAPLLLGTATSMGRDSVIFDLPTSLKVPSWYAVRTTSASDLGGAGCAAWATHGCLWHYVEYLDGEKELYDVSGGPCFSWHVGSPGDPCELNNVVGVPSLHPLVLALHARLEVLRAKVP